MHMVRCYIHETVWNHFKMYSIISAISDLYVGVSQPDHTSMVFTAPLSPERKKAKQEGSVGDKKQPAIYIYAYIHTWGWGVLCMYTANIVD